MNRQRGPALALLTVLLLAIGLLAVPYVSFTQPRQSTSPGLQQDGNTTDRAVRQPDDCLSPGPAVYWADFPVAAASAQEDQNHKVSAFAQGPPLLSKAELQLSNEKRTQLLIDRLKRRLCGVAALGGDPKLFTALQAQADPRPATIDPNRSLSPTEHRAQLAEFTRHALWNMVRIVDDFPPRTDMLTTRMVGHGADIRIEAVTPTQGPQAVAYLPVEVGPDYRRTRIIVLQLACGGQTLSMASSFYPGMRRS